MKILIAILTLIILLPCNHFICAAEEDMDNQEKKILLNRDNVPDLQPKIKRIFEWDNRILVEAGDRFYKVDIKKLTAVPVFGPGDRTIVDLSSQPGNKYYALCKDDVKFTLFSKNENDWDFIELPETLDVERDKAFLISDKNHLIIVANRYIYRYVNGKWKTVEYEPKPWMYENAPWMFRISEDDHLLLFKDKIFIGHDIGQYGGGLVSLDINTGKWEEHFSDIPVTGLAISPKGELWVSQGLAHFFDTLGAVRNYDGKTWSIFSSNKYSGFLPDDKEDDERWKEFLPNDDDMKKWSESEDTKNWPFYPAVFDNLAFDMDGNLILISGDYGVFKYQGGKWIKWINLIKNEDPYFSSLYVLDHNTILIGLTENGLVVLNLSNNTYNSISFGISFNYWNHKGGRHP